MIPYDFEVGETVQLGDELDTIIGFITPDDEENFAMGYRVLLKNNGTQALECISKIKL